MMTSECGGRGGGGGGGGGVWCVSGVDEGERGRVGLLLLGSLLCINQPACNNDVVC
jgi:hypothetical protein